jgi:hypothetical protein
VREKQRNQQREIDFFLSLRERIEVRAYLMELAQ